MAALTAIAQRFQEASIGNEPTTLVAFLREHPELCRDRENVIELAVDEYFKQLRQDSTTSIEGYGKQFAELGNWLQSSIVRQVHLEEYLCDHPELRQLQQDILWPALGVQIGDYQVHEELGRGALARVYLCSQVSLSNRMVVLKVSGESLQEGQTLAKLNHDHIMPIHSVETEWDQRATCLCSPFLGRSTLCDLIEYGFALGIPTRATTILHAANLRTQPSDSVSTSLEAEELHRKHAYIDGVLRIAVKLADALASAHAQGIFHGDLKPSNVLLTPHGEPILLDFNLSRNDDLKLDVRGGTLPYMSPEQIAHVKDLGDLAEATCDDRSEVYSLGILLYQLLSGKLPFDVGDQDHGNPDSSLRLMENQRAGTPSLAAINPLVNDSLASTIARCLAYDANDRFQSMGELQAALKREWHIDKRAIRWLRAHRRPAVATAALSAVVAISAGIWHLQRPSYPVREYNRGVQSQVAGHVQEARIAFDNAVDADPGFLEGRMALARIHLATGEWDTALQQFVALANEQDHPASFAGAGYCYNLIKPHSLAIPWYQRALEHRFESAAVHNNLAVSYEQNSTLETTEERLRQAEEHYQQAIKLAPQSPIIRLNLARFDLQKYQFASDHVPRDGLEQIQWLLTHNHRNSEVYQVAVPLYVAVSRSEPRVLADAIDMLLDATRLGIAIDLEQLGGDPNLELLWNHPRFAELEQLVRQSDAKIDPAISLPRFIDPFE